MNADHYSTNEIDKAAENLAGWLISKPVLRPAQVGAGVVNYLDQHGVWDGIYPEICGYYLQFLAHAASLSETGDDTVYRDAALKVGAWLDDAGGASAEPLTLYHRDMAESDWRNQCLFSFDLAIILRGLNAAKARWPDVIAPQVIARYAGSVARITLNGRLASHLLRAGAPTEIPVKWSTTSGVHHVKAAAALAGLGRPDMAGMIAATLRDEAALFTEQGAARMRELHPFLYCIEGWLTLWGQTLDMGALNAATRAFIMMLAQIDTKTGEMPPFAHAWDKVTRSDVLAQALRAGLVLEAAGQFNAQSADLWAPRRDALAKTLLSRLSAEGGMLFDTVGYHRNSWASMFAWQALSFLSLAQASKLDPVRAATALI